jgi:hypothetical protein
MTAKAPGCDFSRSFFADKKYKISIQYDLSLVDKVCYNEFRVCVKITNYQMNLRKDFAAPERCNKVLQLEDGYHFL